MSLTLEEIHHLRQSIEFSSTDRTNIELEQRKFQKLYAAQTGHSQ